MPYEWMRVYVMCAYGIVRTYVLCYFSLISIRQISFYQFHGNISTISIFNWALKNVSGKMWNAAADFSLFFLYIHHIWVQFGSPFIPFECSFFGGFWHVNWISQVAVYSNWLGSISLWWKGVLLNNVPIICKTHVLDPREKHKKNQQQQPRNTFNGENRIWCVCAM